MEQRDARVMSLFQVVHRSWNEQGQQKEQSEQDVEVQGICSTAFFTVGQSTLI